MNTVETENSILHDSLDLATLKQQIAAEQERQQNRRKQGQYFYWVLAAIFGMTIFGTFGGAFSITLMSRTLDLANIVLVVFAFVYFTPRAMMAYRQHQAYAQQFSSYAPAFVPRPTTADAIRVVSGYGLFGLLFVLIIFLPDWLAALTGLIIAILGWAFGYWLFLRWKYRGGLKRINQSLAIFPNNFYLLTIKAARLMEAGQMDEAANLFQGLLARRRHRNVYSVPLLLNNLGYCLSLTQRFTDALPLLEAAIRISPTLSNTYDSLATWYLEQNLAPERGLELTEIALELNNPKDSASTAIQQATSARALAQTERNTRTEAMLEQALKSISQLEASEAAEVHRQVGYARLAQGNREAAIEHFKKAVELDPNGIYGKLAQKALDKLA
jgi:tetratricopeptide (TPR) repeat protein